VAQLEDENDFRRTSVLAVFADRKEAQSWLTRWHEVNDSPVRSWPTSAEPAAYVPRGGVLPDPADQAPERTARELSWQLEYGPDQGGPEPEAGA